MPLNKLTTILETKVENNLKTLYSISSREIRVKDIIFSIN